MERIQTVETRARIEPNVERPFGYSRVPAGDGESELRDKPLPELLRDLSTDTSTLFRQEAELFRREMDARITRARREVAVLGAGAVIAYVGLLALTACLILAFSLVWAAWAAALFVGAVYVIVGGILLLTGQQKLKNEELAPKESVRSLKTDFRTMREAVR